ncbi:MAG TPA: glycine cleavage system protein GcvH [Actinomycetota bacterium]|jgi:glycine cleavage system H protein|nr:glycine cleavage system protein GcvH [Actinomycetota bacterium]
MTDQVPEDLRYTSEHEWARLEGQVVRVGITDYAQDALGDVVYVELPDVGTRVTAEAPLGEIQSPKAVSDLFAPVTGEITERNEEVISGPELVNEDPYGEGWLVAIRPDDPAELDGLMDASSYEELVESLKDDA